MIDLLTQAHALGGVSTFRSGSRTSVLVTDPQAVRHVFAQHPDRYVKRSHRARVLVGDGVVSTSGDRWKKQRRILQSQFTGRGIRRYEERIRDAARRTAGRWEHSASTAEPRDVAEDMRFFALDTIWRTLTGHALDEETYHELLAAQEVFASLPASPSDTVDLTPLLLANLARIDAVAERAIETARTGAAGPAGPGLLHVLLDASVEHPEYTPKLIRDELVTLLVAGHETTATTLTWLFLLLARHPEQHAWVLAAGSPGSPARAAAIRALISETLRLYPAVWLLPRHALQDDVVNGYRVEAGSSVLGCPYLTHRDPVLWPDPESFRPQRFLTTGGHAAQPGAYYPFGLGPRACLGMQFTLREIVALLDHLLPTCTPRFATLPTGAIFGISVSPDGPMTAVIHPRV
ncbi:cytochrome P450 [Streptomyces sp. NPDC005963]|uniref:cytochrome P450 n=1 Tax=Streptomyces sp. NPDC005963 TaxID=3156721 RepID=UPI003401862C